MLKIVSLKRLKKMTEEKIKALIKAKYPNPEPFWENNKDWCLKLWQEAQKELLKDIIENDVTDFGGYNGISLNSVENRLKQLNNK